MPAQPINIHVVGSVNLDIVATVPALPAPGETLLGASMARHPGGKGANQALAAQRLGAVVSLIACVGSDGLAEEALTLLKQDGVDLAQCHVDATQATGTALILVAASGENQIVVSAGANACLTPAMLKPGSADAVICQLEVPLDTVVAAARQCDSFFCLNAAPASRLPAELIAETDLLVVNDIEAKSLQNELTGFTGLLAISYGSEGAVIMQSGKEIARSTPPRVKAVDTTACGDAFTAALTFALVSGERPQAALDTACIVGALTATTAGAQPSLPYAEALSRFLDTP